MGGGPGNGAAFARKFAAEGYAVALMARREEYLQQLASEIAGSRAYPWDATDTAGAPPVFAQIREELGPVSILVYNAGAGVFGTLDDIGEEDFEIAWRTNALGCLTAVKQILLSLLLTILFTGTGHAWSGEGHVVICEVAWQRLSPAAKELVLRIRGDANFDGTFAGSCAWPDEARRSTHRSTYEYHFVNAAPSADTVELERDCPAYDCVLVAIRRYAMYVAAEPTAERERARRAEALAFLGHFVGDLHQPLHVFGRDRGGNDFEVNWFASRTNLHRVWDHHALERAGISGMADAQQLERDIDPAAARAWAGLDMLTWADESLHLARELAYGVPEDRRLEETYYRRILPVITLRLQQAGVRLAALLDALASGGDASRLRIER